MGTIKDITGQKFGRLTVISHVVSEKWLCRCDCGKMVEVIKYNMQCGGTTSCGCFRLERLRAKIVKHGQANKSLEYYIWSTMRSRCNDSKNHLYGGRGISVCKEWDDFTVFLKDVGPRPSLKHSLDRIDNNKGYEPGNVRWATRTEQNNNTRSNIIVVCKGREMTLTQAARLCGLKPQLVSERIRRYGWTVSRALNNP